MVYGIYKKNGKTGEKFDMQVYATDEDAIRDAVAAFQKGEEDLIISYHPYRIKVNGKDAQDLKVVLG